MNNDLVSATTATVDHRPVRRRRAGMAAIAAVTVALALTGCGARAARRDATATTSTTAPAAATATSTTAATTGTVSTDDIVKDLDSVQADLNGAAQDLQAGPTEATTDTRG